jgi:hypothetical protein
MSETVSKEAKKAAADAKTEGFQPMYVKISGNEYVYRGVTRQEWRDLLQRQNLKIAESGEDAVKIAAIKEDEMEELVKASLIYPTEVNDNIAAGVVQSLADAVLLESGFAGPEMEPVRL